MPNHRQLTAVATDSSDRRVAVKMGEEDSHRQLEDRLNRVGFGFFHALLVLLVGLAITADSVEVFGVSFVLPLAQTDLDLDLNTARKGYLDASIFIGQFLKLVAS